MLTIGAFTKDETGTIEGKLCGLGIGTIPVVFERNANKKDNQPDFYLIADPYGDSAYPIGKAWEPSQGKEHRYVKIESPFLTTPVIKASLFANKNNDGQLYLIWYSPDDKQLKADTKPEVEQPKSEAARATKPQTRRMFGKAPATAP